MIPPRSDEASLRKRRKALRYAEEPSRYELSAVRATMNSEHGVRMVEFNQGSWSCSCEFFDGHQFCSHVLALEAILSQQARVRLQPVSGDSE
jgi:SWIM zinc finger